MAAPMPAAPAAPATPPSLAGLPRPRLRYSPDVPFGGYKQSGTGREMGVAGFEEYLEIKSIALPAGRGSG